MGTMSLPMTRHAPRRTFVVRGNPDEPVHRRQWFEMPGRDDGLAETWCYTDGFTYGRGDTITLYGISTEARLNVRIYRDGRVRLPVDGRNGIATRWTDTPADASVSGCQWPELTTFRVGKDWPSGAYMIEVAPANSDDPAACARHLVVIRPGTTESGNLLLVTADATWQAYNDWGGSNHYEGIIDPASNRFAPRLSRRRPFARGLLELPADAPRTVPGRQPPFGAPVDYPHMEWAWQRGYSKKYASAGWASYERHFVHWAESAGYSLDMVSQLDLHHRPEVLDGYGCVVMVGHDEYWSWEMRDAIDDYVRQGGHVARFAGNFFWQIRLEDSGLVQVCHKYRAREEDSVYRTDKKHLTTNCWEAPETGRPGHATFGLDGSRGIYAGWGGLTPRGSGGFTLYRPEHWAFNGTGLGYGDVLGSESRIFGYEVDGLDYRIEDGLPFPVAKKHLPENLQILGLGLARLLESGTRDDPAELFVGMDDALFVAQNVHGNTDPETLDRISRGSGMIVSFTRGKGEVFHAGTTEWVAGLLRGDPAVERVTRNVIDRFVEAR
jgi:hypothetical protein